MSLDSLQDAYPLSAVQQGILYHSASNSNKDDYVSHITLSLNGTLDATKLQIAWQEVTAHYASLRTSFVWQSVEEPLQLVHNQAELDWQVIDCSDSTKQEADRVAAQIKIEHSRPFDLTQAPLMRFRLLQFSPSRTIMLWSIHHLLADGWSTPIILNRVFECYSRQQSQTPHNIQNSQDISYKRYVNWQRQYEKTVTANYWRDYLAHVKPTPLRISPKSLIATESNIEICRTQHRLTSLQSTQIRQNCQRAQITLASFMVGAWALITNRLTSNKTPLIGVTVSGRRAPIADIDSAVGLYLNTLPLKVDCDEPMPIALWLQKVQQQLQLSNEHDALAVADIQSYADRQPGQALFDTVIAVEGHAGDLVFSTDDNSLQGAELDYAVQSHFGLSMLIMPSESIQLTLVHNPSLVSSDMANRLIGQFETHINDLCIALQSRTSIVDLASKSLDDATAGFLQQSVGTSQARTYTSINQWFNDCCSQHANCTALVTPDKQISYAQLHEQVAKLAVELKKLVLPGSLVALRMTDKTLHIVAMFAILEVRCAYTPIDPTYPKERIEQILLTAEPALIISDAPYQENYDTECAIVEYQALAAGDFTPTVLQAENSTQRDKQNVSPELAYVLFTSGSTGEPKGVEVTHVNLAYSTAERIRHYDHEPSRFLLLSSFAFDSSVAGIYWTLLSGCTLILPNDAQQRNLIDLSKLIEREKVTHTLCLPTVYRLLVEQSNPGLLLSLETVIVAGESASAALVQEHYLNLPNCQLYNEYGPTEGTVWTSAHLCRPDDTDPLPIGRTLSRTVVLIVDDYLRSCPQGIEGEILIGGPNLARGYRGRHSATNEAFINKQYRNIDCDRWYKSGDRGYLSDGNELIFIGRMDNQLKLRGQRIEPAEIESVLARFRGILSAAVICKPATQFESARLIAYLEPSKAFAEKLDHKALATHMEERLQPVMCPSYYIELQTLPVLLNGKVDRDALVQMTLDQSQENQASTRVDETNSEMEQLIIGFVSSLLGGKSVALTDNFFHIGGDSISAMKLCAQLQSQTNVPLSYGLFIECENLRETANMLRLAMPKPETVTTSILPLESGEI